LLAAGSDISLEELTYVAGNEELPADRIGDIGGLKKLYWNGGTLKRMFYSFKFYYQPSLSGHIVIIHSK